DEVDLEEAAKIRRIIVNENITKYNVDRVKEFALGNIAGRKVIFIPGQVADDASLRLGCLGDIRSIEELIIEVRRRNPDAFILFKPHPDVASGNRSGAMTSD